MLWKGIKSIVSLKSNNLDTISHVTDNNGSDITNPSKVANQFNHFLLVLLMTSQRRSQEVKGLHYLT